jgi:GalNAc-alpha-(1->4)-GalNAc-alpha-(1->3)-diNAcBac-PP-undecaprenol alpha-1,4-N-acetyl-D-galactosaminyltransferase
MIIDGENGFLVPVLDDQVFQERIQLLINKEDLRKQMSEKARETIKEFSVQVIGKQFLDFLLS